MVDAPGSVNLGQLLLRAFRWFDEELVARLRHAGWPQLTRAHSLVFANLDTTGTRTSELARRAGVSRQAIHKTVHELDQLGLIALREDTTNRSAKLVIPTAEGRRSIKAALAIFTDLEAELINRIGPEPVAQLRNALEQDWGQLRTPANGHPPPGDPLRSQVHRPH